MIEKISHAALPWLRVLMLMRWLVILVEKMSHTALPWLLGFRGYEVVCCNCDRKNESHRIIMVTGFNSYEVACCDSGRKNESHRITLVTGFSWL